MLAHTSSSFTRDAALSCRYGHFFVVTSDKLDQDSQLSMPVYDSSLNEEDLFAWMQFYKRQR